MINFDTLSDAAYRGEEASRENQTELWKAFFALENWLFITDATQLSSEQAPFIGYVDERPWFFIFTDSVGALEFAKKYELADQNGDCLYISMKPTDALKFLESAQGKVTGIRVNEGEHGWFAPTENVFAIYRYLYA